MTSAYTSLAETQARGCTKPKGAQRTFQAFVQETVEKGLVTITQPLLYLTIIKVV